MISTCVHGFDISNNDSVQLIKNLMISLFPGVSFDEATKYVSIINVSIIKPLELGILKLAKVPC
jgi:hypothetical protein